MSSAPKSSLPSDTPALLSDVQSILAELERSEREAESIAAGLSDDEMNRRPSDGGWSVAECLEHLSKMNAVYVNAMSSALDHAKPNGLRPIHPGWFSRYFIRSMDAPARRRFKAPKQGLPQRTTAGSGALRDFVASHDAVRTLLQRSSGFDFNRVRFKNPFVPLLRFTVGTGILVILAHDRRHLWQARQVRRAMAEDSAA